MKSFQRIIVLSAAAAVLFAGLGASAALANRYNTGQALVQAMFLALGRGDTGQMKTLIAQGANIDGTLTDVGLQAENVFGQRAEKLMKTDSDYQMWPLLTWAAFLEEESAVRLLVQAGANVNQTDRNDTTPLHWAAWTGNYPITKILYFNGASTDVLDVRGRSPFDFALISGQTDVINLLRRAYH